MPRHSIVACLFALALAAASGPAPAAAYSVYLKDGSRIEARERVRFEGDKAIIILPNGTETFLAATEIDLERTERSNRSASGGALLLEDGQVTQIEDAPAPPPRETLADLIARGDARPAAAAPQPPARPRATAPAARTAAGFVDLGRLPRYPYPGRDLPGRLRAEFGNAGLPAPAVHAGSAAERVFVEATADSEAQVFAALRGAAAAFLAARGRARTLELLLLTSSGEAAGQFVLTPAEAAEVAGAAADLPRFYVTHVEF